MSESESLVRLQELLQQGDAVEKRLAESALLIAQAGNPEVDVSAYLRQIDDWASYVRDRFDPQTADAAERIEQLNRFLFDELGFAGNTHEYSDPQNSFLSSVMDRRLGIPITLSILYIELGRRLGLPLQGVAFPGHFLVILPVSHGAVVLDPYSEGASLEMADLERLLSQADPGRHWENDQIRRLLEPADLRDILVRILRNLKAVYWQSKDFLNGIWVQDIILGIDPDLTEERRDRGILKEQMGHFQSALQDFADYLREAPDAVDADLIRARMVDLNNYKSRLH
jgi:regulator of sirC expression with transglutaminase-like and TPR domain